MNRIITRMATTADAALIAAISRETFYDAFAAQNTQADMDKFLAEQFSEEQLMAEAGLEDNLFFLAELDKEIAGYLFMKEDSHLALLPAPAIEISRIYSRKHFIGKGIGKALMETALAHAKKIKKEIVWLGVWEHNQRAIQFYTSFGFTKFSEHDFVLGNDVQRDWLMKLPVI